MGSQRIPSTLCCFRPSENGNHQRSCCDVPGDLEGQNIESGATKLFEPGLVEFPFRACCFVKAHFLVVVRLRDLFGRFFYLVAEVGGLSFKDLWSVYILSMLGTGRRLQ